MSSSSAVPVGLPEPTGLGLLQELQRHYHAQVSFPMTRSQWHEFLKIFLNYLALPATVHEPLKGRIPAEIGGNGYGHKSRKPSQPDGEHKELVHVNSFALKHFRTLPAWNIPEVRDFYECAYCWFQVASVEMRKHCLALNEVLPLRPGVPKLSEQLFPTGREDLTAVVRMLAYKGHGGMNAMGHYDKGFTIAIKETKPGLRLGPGPEALQLAVHRDGVAKLFMGANCYRHVTTAILPAWHDVVEAPESVAAPTTAPEELEINDLMSALGFNRAALVGFFDSPTWSNPGDEFSKTPYAYRIWS